MKNLQPRTSEQYATLAAVTRDDLLRPSDWSSGTRNSLRAALEVFELLAAGAAIVRPKTHEEQVTEALQAAEQRKALINQCTNEPMRGDVWRTVDGKNFYAVTFRSLKPQMAFGFATLELAEVACLGVAMVDDDDTLGLVFDAEADRLTIDPNEWRACYDEVERGQADTDLLAMTQAAREFTPTCEVYKAADVARQEE